MWSYIFIIGIQITCVLSLSSADLLKIASRSDIMAQINKVRTKPAQFAAIIQNSYVTYTSKSELQATLAFLYGVTPLTAVTNETGLDAVAQMHANYLNSKVSDWLNPNLGCKSNRVGDRVNLAGSWENRVGENIGYGVKSAEELVAMWIIDSQIASKKNRMNIFEPGFTEVGVGISGSNSSIIVAVFADDFECKESCVNVPNIGGKYNCQGDPFAGGLVMLTSGFLILLSLFIGFAV